MSDLGFFVNNVGHLVEGRFLESDPKRLQMEGQLNMNAITLLTKDVINNFDSSKGKKMALVQMSATGGELPCPRISHYTATKRYDMVFSQMIRKNLNTGVKANGIKVKTVHPGVTTTKLVNYFHKPNFSSYPEEVSRAVFQNLDLNLKNKTAGTLIHQI